MRFQRAASSNSSLCCEREENLKMESSIWLAQVESRFLNRDDLQRELPFALLQQHCDLRCRLRLGSHLDLLTFSTKHKQT